MEDSGHVYLVRITRLHVWTGLLPETATDLFLVRELDTFIAVKLYRDVQQISLKKCLIYFAFSSLRYN